MNIAETTSCVYCQLRRTHLVVEVIRTPPPHNTLKISHEVKIFNLTMKKARLNRKIKELYICTRTIAIFTQRPAALKR
jgi:hypothetical protein